MPLPLFVDRSGYVPAPVQAARDRLAAALGETCPAPTEAYQFLLWIVAWDHDALNGLAAVIEAVRADKS